MMDTLRALALDLGVTFALSPAGRILGENDPDGSPPPRLVLAGCRAGNRLAVRHDLDDLLARGLEALVARMPPWWDPDRPPDGVESLAALLQAPPQPVHVIHRLPNGLAPDPAVEIVAGEGPDGRRLAARLAREGLPAAQTGAGFLTLGDFWPPWCVALAEGEIAAIAFAARTGAAGCEIGVYTFQGFRGRGLAAAVTAAWSSLPSLAGKRLFYSASWANRSSLRVIDRLALPRLGVSLRIA